MPGPGRNDPCPCGTGRKFKQCCLETWAREDSARLRRRALEGHVIGQLLDYIDAMWGPDLVNDAWDDFFLDAEVAPDDLEATPEFESMFIPWLTLGYVPQPDDQGEIPKGWPRQTIGFAWLSGDGRDADPADAEYIRVACASPMSAFAIEAVTPGRAIEMTDILTGRQFRVLEEKATETVSPGDVIFARVVTIDDVSALLGLCPWLIQADAHSRIVEFRGSLVGDRLMTRDELAAYATEIRDLYLEITDDLLAPASSDQGSF